MNKIKCPKCGEEFEIDNSQYMAIVNQIQTKEFENRVQQRVKERQDEFAANVKAAKAEAENDYRKKLADKENEITNLHSKLQQADLQKQLAVKEVTEKANNENMALKAQLDSKEKDFQLKERDLQDQNNKVLKEKDDEIERLKDFRAKQNVKLLGETLEQHCEIEFNKLRPLFPRAYFEKDNDANTESRSKADFIFRDYDENGMEYISIAFEMKNKSDMTATKKKNEHFFKELNKDRNEKKCEYAVLVSLLEEDNDFYNTGIVNISYQYPEYQNMFVIRPQFFIQTIMLLRDFAQKTLKDKHALMLAQNQNLDLTNFENKLKECQSTISKNFVYAGKNFKDAIDEIDKTIHHLEETKRKLLLTEKNLRIATEKVEDISIKKLAKGNATVLKLIGEQNTEE